ncbi:hypothetical protein KIW84_030980 [Lathyrus oleraceus]|uniref:Reverse transcriptase zinc-binding domain-containing protein n=1 Tax=Pisum sativum TaxID=3888 RepID=A0A9D5AWX8_PEA|nr:hypothetical protein KIW84_030980 [Pisum sativum]
MSSYWMHYLSFPKKVIHAIYAICRSFLWTGRDSIAKKSLIAWKQVCSPRCKGGLNIISLADWNKVCLAKLLWNLECLETTGYCEYMQNWSLMTDHFNMKKVYEHIRGDVPNVNWKGLLHKGLARSQAIFSFSLACHNKLPTKVRLKRFGMVDDDKCVLCPAVKRLSIFFSAALFIRNGGVMFLLG